MQDIIRESLFGQAVNHITKGKVFPYPEDRADFQIPDNFLLPHQRRNAEKAPRSQPLSTGTSVSTRAPSPTPPAAAHRSDSDQQTLCDERAQETIERSVQVIKGLEEGKDADLVGWYSDSDPENPQNWSNSRKIFFMVLIQLLTFSVYIGSAIYTPSIPGIMEKFNVSLTKATLGLSLYVLGYGIGPMVLSPLSEIPRIGRLNVYMVSLFIFAILQIPTALAPNYSTLMAMRFLAGFAGSPALSTGGASLGDTFKPMTIPYVISMWAAGAVAGPVVGPVAGGYAAQITGWRTPLYMLLGLAFFCFIVLFFTFPETAPATLLLRRAQRLRKLTGNDKLQSQSEIEQSNLAASTVIYDALLRPFRLFLEPMVAFIDIYIALVYAIFYLWFEAFPIVFTEMYHFSLGASGLPFLGFIVALIPTLGGYIAYQKYWVIPEFKRTGVLVPESRLKVAIFGSGIIPIALLIFGWTSRVSVHWIAPIIGASLYLPGIYLVFQGALVYLPMSYHLHAASILAGNALLRGITGAVFPLFGRALFETLTIGGGSSLLAGLSILMIPPLVYFYKHGPQLRKMSKFATS